MSKSKTSGTQTATTTPTNPQWVTDGAQGLSGMITGLAGKDPQSFVAGPSALQNQQFGLAGIMGGNASGQLTGASSAASGLANYNPQQIQAAQNGDQAHVQGQTAYGGIQNYMNPYTENVINAGLQDNERSRQMQRISTGDQFQAANAFGGSRQGVENAETNSAYDRNAQSLISNQLSQGYGQALQASQSDADRAQQAGIFNAGADNAAGMANTGYQQQASLANQSADLAGAGVRGQGASQLQQLGLSGYDALNGAGATQQGIAQNQAGAPLTLAQILSGSYGSLPLNLFQGSNQTGTSTGTSTGSLLDTAGKVVGTAAKVASAFSDERLKTDIRPAGSDHKGRDWYDYRYLWDAPDVTRRGVMAQQILASDPDAVSMHESGYLMVDYSKLEG